MKKRLLLRAVLLTYGVGAAAFSFYLAVIVHPFWATDIWGLALAKGFLIYLGVASAVLSVFLSGRVRIRTENSLSTTRRPSPKLVA